MKTTPNEVPDGFVLLQRHDGKACYAACLDGGRFHGWLMWKHPDGQWVSQRKLAAWEVMQAEDQRDDNIVHETATGGTPAAQEVPPAWKVNADEAELYRGLTGDAMALGYDGIPAALEALRVAGVAQEVAQQAAKGEVGVQAKTWKDAPYKLDHVAEAWARGWNDACAEFAKPQSDLTTIPCPECAGKGVVSEGETCDECHGQGNIIVSRKDLADLAPTTSTAIAPALASPTSPDSSGQAGAQVVRDALEAEIIARRIAITPENEGGFHAVEYGDQETPKSKGYGTTPSAAIRALRTSGTGSAA